MTFSPGRVSALGTNAKGGKLVGSLPEMPTWEDFLLPVLEVLSDGAERSYREVQRITADHVGLSEQQRGETLNSGDSRAHNRIGWALSALVRAKALDRPKRARYVITEGGRALLRDHPTGLTEKMLAQLPAWADYEPVSRGSRVSSDVGGAATLAADTLDPVEQIEGGIGRLNADVGTQLLARLREQDPAFLEQSVLDVLVAMGYGGAEQRAKRIGGTGDGGVDGVIDQDPLGLEQVYVQAKRYGADNVVGREAIQAFVGALHGNQASQGIFITTSRFSTGAREYASRIQSRLVLIDGERLVSLMIKYGVGTQTVKTYSVIELDEDYFE